jgi:hypothetical protein
MLGGRTLARESGSPAEVAIQCIWDGRAWGSAWLQRFPLRRIAFAPWRRLPGARPLHLIRNILPHSLDHARSSFAQWTPPIPNRPRVAPYSQSTPAKTMTRSRHRVPEPRPSLPPPFESGRSPSPSALSGVASKNFGAIFPFLVAPNPAPEPALRYFAFLHRRKGRGGVQSRKNRLHGEVIG